ncbi:PH domain-containing protein [Mycobacterium sp.]|uniref:PH domain-containing protein n=1 Tax=Mycobacterium sp. TaxID=1785 RepID=UPI0031D2F668
MPYPDNVLAEGEQIVLHRHPHWKRLIGAVLVLILATGLASFAAAVVNSREWDPTAKNVVFGVIWGIWLVVVGGWTLWPYLRWLTTHFVVTDRRVMFRQGVLRGSGIDLPLARIDSVEFRRRIVDRILRTGTLIVESASQDPWEFHDIPRVRQVHALLYHEVFDTRPRTREVRPRSGESPS